mmetsp:Transcript_23306/g.25885  ORF Transcript_23306/g.25885 Transcript_23306/m.25885 type:complete len:278 (-) Transcript_23306:231-1064(-)
MNKKDIACRYYLLGKCKYGDNCHWLHAGDVKSSTVDHTEDDCRSQRPCKFFQSGNCLRGDTCPYLHSVIQPADTAPKNDAQCSVCLENVLENQKTFGLLQNCDHVFCLQCIRSWRKSNVDADSGSKGVTHKCPVCRELSHYVIPSSTFAKGDEKHKIEQEYKNRLGKIPCKYYKFSDGVCPFGASCFYAHVTRDGKPGPNPKVRRRRNQVSSRQHLLITLLHSIRDAAVIGRNDWSSDEYPDISWNDFIAYIEEPYLSTDDDLSDDFYPHYLQDIGY